MVGLTSPQKRRLLELMASGFKKYAEKYGDRRHVGALTDREDRNRILIFGCGAEFRAILDGRTDWLEDLPQLREDLFNLTECGCPLLDIIDLMFACTKGRSPAISDRLEGIGLKEPSLHLLRTICQLASDKISLINASGAGPLFFLSEMLPELSEEERARLTHDISRLPDLIGLFGDMLGIYPSTVGSHAPPEAVLKNCEIVFFYMLLDHFDFGFPALGRLLRAMRRARSVAFPKTRYLRRIHSTDVKLGERSKSKGRSDERDPLGEKALQRRLHRFLKENENWQFLMKLWMLRYLSDEFSERRASGSIFFDLLSELPTPFRFYAVSNMRPDASPLNRPSSRR